MFVVIIALIVFAVSMVGLGSLMLRREFRGCVKADFVGNNSLATDVLDEGDIAHLPAIGLHIYKNETATFRVKMLNLFKVVDAKGDKMNQAETVTLFNDMCFIAPATLIGKKISWEVLNETTVKGVYLENIR